MTLTSIKVDAKTHLKLNSVKIKYETALRKRYTWDEFLELLGLDSLFILALRICYEDPSSRSFKDVIEHLRMAYFGTAEKLSVYDDVLVAYLTKFLSEIKLKPEYTKPREETE